MEINYYIILPVGLIIVLLLIWLLRRNSKDKKDYEKELIDSDQNPGKHPEGHV
jgi:hypothetical protein